MDSTVGDGYLAVLIKDDSHLRLVGGPFVLGIRAESTIFRLVPQHPPPLLGRLTPRLGRYIARVRTNTVLRTKKCPTLSGLSTIFPQSLSDRLLPVTDRRWRTD